ncbi:MAG: transposase family protein, partial [Robiginitomaculum sp.]|nr:transposase family protein [Robiginitomaculum sp.]
MTLQRNYLEKFRFLMKEYEQVKAKTHPKFKRVGEFYKAHDTERKNFLKYYNRHKQSGKDIDLLPQKRGPKYKSRRPLTFIENKVTELREKGNNRYEIVNILRPKLKSNTPSPSGVYNILKRKGMNRLTPVMKKNKRKIIKQRAGEMGHIDAHYLSKSIVKDQSRKRYLVCIVDDCTRLAWAEIVYDIKSITVMFAALKCLNILADRYDIRFEEMLSDNGPEFGPRTSKQKEHHPFERLLIELEIKHRYTRPYRPQTNGKVERIWRTIEDDMLRDTHYDSDEELKEELLQYMYYYNEV